jgi:hypothetical protein
MLNECKTKKQKKTNKWQNNCQSAQVHLQNRVNLDLQTQGKLNLQTRGKIWPAAAAQTVHANRKKDPPGSSPGFCPL